MRTLFYLGIFFFHSIYARALDWTQFRGPDSRGIAGETIRTNWLAEPPRQLWKVALQPGLSSLAIMGSRIYTQVRRPAGQSGEQEYCIALDANSGREAWARPVGLADYPQGGVGSDDGPRSTPTVAGGRVFVLSSYLQLHAFDAFTGEPLWDHDLTREFGGIVINWQNAASPIVEGDLVIVNGNGRANECILAFRVGDGSLAWKRHNDRMTHATPVLANIHGTRQLIFFTQSSLLSLEPATGDVLWRHIVNYNGVSVAASPVVDGDYVYCSRAYPASPALFVAGSLMIKINGATAPFSTEHVWSRTNALMNHWSTPVIVGEHLYGNYGQDNLTLKCLELKTGTEKWSVSGFGYGSVLSVNGLVLALTDSGELVLVEPNPDRYTEIERFRALRGKCWNAPAISNGRIYVRSTTELVALEAAPPASAPRLKLFPGLLSDGVTFELLIGTEDNSPVASNRWGKIEVFRAPDLVPAVWEKMTNIPEVSNGRLRVEDSRNEKVQRFYRVQERP